MVNQILNDADFEENFEMELNKLKDFKHKRRFNNFPIQCKNCLFVEVAEEVNEVKLLDEIFCDIDRTKSLRSRYVQRIIPIHETCKAYINDITNVFISLIDQYFPKTNPMPSTYAINIKIRNNNTIKRDQIIETIGKLVNAQSLEYKVNLDTPDKIILIEIICNLCGIVVIDGSKYTSFKKLNLLQYLNSLQSVPES